MWNRIRLSRVGAMLLLCGLGVLAWGCGDDAVEPPTAYIIMLHESGDLGTVEILVDGVPVGTVDPSTKTEPLALSPGKHMLGVRNAGAANPLLEEEIDFAAQTYLMALTGPSASLSFWSVDTTAPKVAPGSAAVEVVSLFVDASGETTPFDVTVGDQAAAAGVVNKGKSDFVTVPAGTVTVTVRNEGETEGLPVKTEDFVLADGGAYMVLIKALDGGTALGLELIVIR